MWNLKKQTHRNKGQIGGCQRQKVGERGNHDQMLQTSSYKMNKFWGCNGEYSDSS